MDWSLLGQAFWNLLAGMVKRAKTLPENVHKHEGRSRILDVVRHDPGKNLARICDELGMKRGTASYHLYVLERAGAIGSHLAAHTHHFFPPHATPEERAALAVLRRERALEVVNAVIVHPGIVQRDLLVAIGMSRKVFRAYARELTREGLVQEQKAARRRLYVATPKLHRVLELVRGNGIGGPPPSPPRGLVPEVGAYR